MNEKYLLLKETIEKYDTIIIHRHSRPDGDAMGSQLGLKEIIKTNYPNKKVYAIGDINKKLLFMGTVDEVSSDKYEGALALILDSAEPHLVYSDNYNLAKETFKIDHHIPRSKFTTYEIVDTSYESCCGLISDIAFSLGLEVNKYAAEKLFTGLVTDSGRFRYSSTTPKSFEIASKLLACGVEMESIYSKLYVDDLKVIKLKAQCTLNFNITKENVAYLKNTKEFVKQSGVDFFTISRGMVGTMSGVDGIDIWVNFTEDEENNVVVAELRSNKYNINQIAVKYGGGGHLNASGASLKSFDEADLMLEDLDKLVRGEFGDK